MSVTERPPPPAPTLERSGLFGPCDDDHDEVAEEIATATTVRATEVLTGSDARTGPVTADYLRAVFEKCDGGWIIVSRIVGTYRKPGSDQDQDKWRSSSHRFADVERAATDAASWAEQGFATFVRCTTIAEPIAETKRGTVEQTAALPMLWLDLDIRGGVHATDAADLPTADEARVLVDKFPLPPSLILDSGGGWYPLWLLDDPVTDRAAATELLARFRQWWVATFDDADRHLDSGVFELTRVLRPAGIRNTKYDDHVVSIIDGDLDDPVRYEVADILEHLPHVDAPASAVLEVPEQSVDPFDVLRRIGAAGHRHVAERLVAEGGFTLVDDDRGTWRKVKLLRPSCRCHGSPTSGHSITIGGASGSKDYTGWAEVQSDKVCSKRVDRLTGEIVETPVPAGSHQVGRLLALALHDDDNNAAKTALMFAGFGMTGEGERAVRAAVPASAATGLGVAPPPGIDLWTPESEPARPPLPDGMLYGPVGEWARGAAPHTEADPAPLYMQALTIAGAIANRGPHAQVGNSNHHAALFTLIVGDSNRGGKGTSLAGARGLGRVIDRDFIARRMLGGFGSGEAIIDELAPTVKDDGTEVAQPDTRAVILESEFGAILAGAKRDGSKDSAIIRNAWDGEPLASRTRGRGKRVATDYHLGAIGHITSAELRAKLTDVDIFNGFLNRFLIVWAERTQLLPDGGNIPDDLHVEYGQRVKANIDQARGAGRMERTDAARDLWHDIYYQLDEDRPGGLLQEAIARSAAQCVRLQLVLAVCDGSASITEDHVGAAYQIWTYCRASAGHVFGHSTGNKDADRLLAALRDAGGEGLTGTAQLELFNRKGDRSKPARELLERLGLVETVSVPSGGRPSEVTFAINPRSQP